MSVSKLESPTGGNGTCPSHACSPLLSSFPHSLGRDREIAGNNRGSCRKCFPLGLGKRKTRPCVSLASGAGRGGQGQLTMGGGTWRPALRCGIHEPPVGPGGQGQPSLGLNPTHRPGPALRGCWAPIQLNQRCQAGPAVSAPGQSRAGSRDHGAGSRLECSSGPRRP